MRPARRGEAPPEVSRPEHVTGSGRVTVRIALCSLDRHRGAVVLEQLASHAYRTVTTGSLRLRAEVTKVAWLAYEAGLVEGSPIRIEVVGIDPSATAAGPIIERCDVVVVLGCADGLAASGTGAPAVPTASTASGATAADARETVLFVRDADAGAAPAAGSVPPGCRATATSPVVAISDDGAGVRYGFAIAVRAALQRWRAQTEAGVVRDGPTELDRLIGLVEGTDGAPAVVATPTAPRPAAPIPAPTPAPLPPPTQEHAARHDRSVDGAVSPIATDDAGVTPSPPLERADTTRSRSTRRRALARLISALSG